MLSYQQSDAIPCDDVILGVGFVAIRRIPVHRTARAADMPPRWICDWRITTLLWNAAFVGIIVYCIGQYHGHYCCEPRDQPRSCWYYRTSCPNDCDCEWSTNDRLRLWGQDLMAVGSCLGVILILLPDLWERFGR